MSSYKVAKEGKQIMTQLIAERKLEEAALIGLLYQTPIRIGDAYRRSFGTEKGGC